MKLIQEYIEWIMILVAVIALLWYTLGGHVIQYYAIVATNKAIVGVTYLIAAGFAAVIGWAGWRFAAQFRTTKTDRSAIRILYID